MKTNPTETDVCGAPECVGCSQPGGKRGKMCRKNKIVYEAQCKKCPDTKYIGESDRNLMTRGAEHVDLCNKKRS